MASGSQVVDLARAQIGDPYVFGAEGPNAFDCSGLVEWVYDQLGIKVPRTTTQMMAPGSPLIPIQPATAKPGDLVFSNWIGRPSSHVAILTDRGTVIEAPQPGQTVKETIFGPNYRRHVDAWRRVPGLEGANPTPADRVDAITAGVATGLGVIPGVPSAISHAKPTVGETLDVLSSAASGMVEGVQNMGRLAGLITHAFMPSAILRGVFFFGGWVLILIGVWFLSMEVRDT